MARESATGGGDCLIEGEWLVSMPFRSSEVPGGVISGVETSPGDGEEGEAEINGVLLCLEAYEVERGRHCL